MKRPRHIVQQLICSVAALLMIFGLASPATIVFAEGSDGSDPAASTTCSDPAPTNQPHPTGSDAVTYAYNSCTGLWENPYYTWSPKTQNTTPKAPLVYSCNTTKWQWQAQKWEYDPASKSFYQATIHKLNLPANAIIAADSIVPCAPAPVAPATSTNTGTPGSSNSSTSGATITNTTGVTMTNSLGSSAVAGNASVTGNTTGGNATSGNATAMANVINAIQTSSALNGGDVATFVANINGDVQGDLVIDPSQLQPASGSSMLADPNLTVNNQVDGQITNTITLNANTGDAKVANNTTGGSATSGNATAIADVINMLDSIVSAGKSFVGVININGNLTGNILMPQSFLDSLIASNAPSTTLALSPSAASNLGITNTNNLTTTNNIEANAATGHATVAGNTNAGNATTGDASTTVRVFNLTGSQVMAANCLLVFVNVSGTWVGVIMDAPAGSTAAALGSGVTENDTNGTIANTTNDAITNNILANAQSGDATVSHNTNGGSATSGDARTAVNLLNMNEADFNLTGWFGVLFINVFGNWYGSFGTVQPSLAGSQSSGSDSTVGSTTTQQPTPQAFRFVQATTASTSSPSDDTTAFTTASAHPSTAVLGASTVPAAVRSSADTQSAGNYTMLLISGGLLASGLVLLIIERRVGHSTRA